MLGKYNLINAKKFCCEDISLIENYEKAINDSEFYGTHYFNNGEIELRAKECPDGFVRGRLKSSLMKLKQYQVVEND